MTLEEMQTVWSEMTERIEEQEHLTNDLIVEMTQQKFSNKIGKISMFESIGAVVCFIMAAFIILNIGKLDTWYLLASGIFIAAYLIFIPIMILRSIANMKRINILTDTNKQALIDFTKRRKQFLFLQRLGLQSNFLLMVFILPVASKLLSDKDLFVEGTDICYWYIPMMLLFIIPFSIWGYRSYKKMTASAEHLIKDLEAQG